MELQHVANHGGGGVGDHLQSELSNMDCDCGGRHHRDNGRQGENVEDGLHGFRGRGLDCRWRCRRPYDLKDLINDLGDRMER